MSDLPTPLYRIGDTVYRPFGEAISERLPCPDCLDTRAWKVTTPAGVEHELVCLRCSRDSYVLDRSIPSLTVERLHPTVKRLTIGAVTVKSHPFHGDDHVEYMANETGVGSGQVYYERQLYPTEEAGRRVAEAQAALKNAEIDATRKAITTRRFSNLQVKDAAIAALRDAVYDSWSALRLTRMKIEDLLDDSDGSELMQDLRETVQTIERYTAENFLDCLHPLDELLAAVEAVNDPAARAALARFRERTKLEDTQS